MENPDQPARQPVLLLALRVSSQRICSALRSAGQELGNTALALEMPLVLFALPEVCEGEGITQWGRIARSAL